MIRPPKWPLPRTGEVKVESAPPGGHQTHMLIHMIKSVLLSLALAGVAGVTGAGAALVRHYGQPTDEELVIQALGSSRAPGR